MKKIYILSLVVFSVMADAQVTIGSKEKPIAGAILDLKQEGTTEKGLGMPRVELQSLTGDLAQSLDATATTGTLDKDVHVGLVVYNTNQCVPNGDKGLHVWDGVTWQGLGIPDKIISPNVYEVPDSRDGEVYLARNFGITAGDWMLENMRYVPNAADGYTGFTHTAAGSINDKYYAYPEGNESPYIPATHPSSEWASKKKNGLLYNWAAATNGENTSTNDQGQGQVTEGPLTPVQGICPSGWYVPSDREWNDLEREIYNNAHLYSTYTEVEKNTWIPWNSDWETTITSYRPTTNPSDAQGSAMKSPCPPIGSTITTNGKSLTTQQGGFNLLLAGNGDMGNMFIGGALLWSSSSGQSSSSYPRITNGNNSGMGRNGKAYRGSMFSVRCKKD